MQGRLRRWLAEPLLHFLLLGIVIHVWMLHDAGRSSSRISVGRADLVGFMQGRARYFDEKGFSAAYDRLSGADREKLVCDYVRQEALYREARRKGLDEADPVIRGRLVQQMEALLRDEALATTPVSPAELEAYYRSHLAEYTQPAVVSFTQVFFEGRRRGAMAEEAARATLATLQQRHVTANEALAFGDRFPYQRNFADVAPESVRTELGEEVVQALHRVPTATWVGPIPSPLGHHLLYVTERQAEKLPPLDALHDIVLRDAMQAKQLALGDKAIDAVVSRYAVELRRE